MVFFNFLIQAKTYSPYSKKFPLIHLTIPPLPPFTPKTSHKSPLNSPPTYTTPSQYFPHNFLSQYKVATKAKSHANYRTSDPPASFTPY